MVVHICRLIYIELYLVWGLFVPLIKWYALQWHYENYPENNRNKYISFVKYVSPTIDESKTCIISDGEKVL